MLLENPSTYVAFAETTIDETDFLAEVVRRTGCGLLLDVNNVFVSATNHGCDPHRYLADFPLAAVGEIHLAGYAEDADDAGAAAADRRPQFAGPRRRLGALRRGDPALRADRRPWSNGTTTCRHGRRCLPKRACGPGHGRSGSRAAGARRCRLKRRSTPSPRRSGTRPDRRRPATHGRFEAPDLRRFSVYRNNVAVGLIGALEARYPVTQRIVGEEFFSELGAASSSRARKPRSPVMIAYGDDFPDFLARLGRRRSAVPYLADVARLENAWVEAYHAEEAGVLSSPIWRRGRRLRSWRRASNSIPPRGCCALPRPPPRSGPPIRRAPCRRRRRTPERGEDALIARPEADVSVRILPGEAYAFAARLASGATLARGGGALDDTESFGTHLIWHRRGRRHRLDHSRRSAMSVAAAAGFEAASSNPFARFTNWLFGLVPASLAMLILRLTLARAVLRLGADPLGRLVHPLLRDQNAVRRRLSAACLRPGNPFPTARTRGDAGEHGGDRAADPARLRLPHPLCRARASRA